MSEREVKACPSNAEVSDACLSFRHDFGLMNEGQQSQLMFTAREWFRAWSNTLNTRAEHERIAELESKVAQLKQDLSIVADANNGYSIINRRQVETIDRLRNQVNALKAEQEQSLNVPELIRTIDEAKEHACDSKELYGAEQEQPRCHECARINTQWCCDCSEHNDYRTS